jgi:hypothetical protein
VVFLTSEEINIVNALTGNLALEKSLNSNGKLSTVVENTLFAYDQKERALIALDLNSKKVTSITSEKIDFEGKESPTVLEHYMGGLYLHSDQNMQYYSIDGKRTYQTYYPAPKQSGLKKALLYAQGVRAAMISANAYYASAALQNAESELNKQDQQLDAAVAGAFGEVYNELGDAASDYTKNAFQEASKRFNASHQAQHYMLMLTTKDKGARLVRIDKKSGELNGEIDLSKDKTPMYGVDDVMGRVFYKSQSNALTGYRMQ